MKALTICLSFVGIVATIPLQKLPQDTPISTGGTGSGLIFCTSMRSRFSRSSRPIFCPRNCGQDIRGARATWPAGSPVAIGPSVRVRPGRRGLHLQLSAPRHDVHQQTARAGCARLGANARTAATVQRRLDDMVAGLASPGSNERLQFVREVVERKGITPATPDGQRQARQYLVDIIGRVARERDDYKAATASARQLADPIAKLETHSTLYRDADSVRHVDLPQLCDRGDAAGDPVGPPDRRLAGSPRGDRRARPGFRGQGRRIRFLSPSNDSALCDHGLVDSTRPCDAG